VTKADDNSAISIGVQFASSVDRDVLVGKFWVEKKQLAGVNGEKPVPEIEIYLRKDGEPWLFSLADLGAALKYVRQRPID
jgi:hypothetical protein